MRLTLLTEELPGLTPYTGGIGSHFLSLATAVSNAGHDVRILVAHDPRRGPLKVLKANFSIETFPVIPRVHETFRSATLGSSFSSRLASLTPEDIVLAPEWGGWGAALARRREKEAFHLVTNLATSLSQVRAIEPLLGTALLQRTKDHLQSRRERYQTGNSSALLAISTAVLDWARELWGLDGIPAAVIPNFVTLSDFEDIQPQRPNTVPATVPLLVFCGRVSRWKGADVLADAMPRVWSAFPDTHVAFVGRAPAQQDPKTIKDSRIVYLGNRSRQDALSVVAAADLAVFPSRFEGFGMAALEAKALGTPLIATSGSGFDDFCTHGADASLVAPGNVGELADEIVRLLSDEQCRREYARLGRERSKEFSSDAVAPRVLDFFRAVAASGGTYA